MIKSWHQINLLSLIIINHVGKFIYNLIYVNHKKAVSNISKNYLRHYYISLQHYPLMLQAPFILPFS
nr:MAG TPA: hypothetical protein [Caudoviricetes sp.]